MTWLEPFPDALLRPESADPAAVAAARSGLRLAMIAALQRLPVRQRTVLILRDVLGWRSAEVAELLGVSVTAVNSALQRARDQLKQEAPEADEISEPPGQADRALVGRYAAAIENADVAALVELLHEDATLEMPPMTDWFRGRENVGLFLGTEVLTAPGVFTAVPATANGQPALAIYRRAAGRHPTGLLRPGPHPARIARRRHCRLPRPRPVRRRSACPPNCPPLAHPW